MQYEVHTCRAGTISWEMKNNLFYPSNEFSSGRSGSQGPLFSGPPDLYASTADSLNFFAHHVGAPREAETFSDFFVKFFFLIKKQNNFKTKQNKKKSRSYRQQTQ